MLLHLRANKYIRLILDDTDYVNWEKSGKQGDPPELIFIPELKDFSHKISTQDIRDVNAKLDEVWTKYPQFGRYARLEINNPQDLLGEDHALVVT